MSEKHLTEKSWKAFLEETEVKDTGLLKALQAYAKIDPAKDAKAAVEALETISEQAIKIKKANSGNKGLVVYLDEVVKEVNKTKPGLAEALKAEAAKPEPKAAAKPEAEEEEEEESQDLKSLLIGAMKKVKMRKPEDPPVEAMVCKAGAAFGVLLAKKVGAAQKAKLQEMFKDQGSPKFFPGTCEWEEPDLYTFILEALPGGAVKGLKAFFKEQTDINYKLQVRDLAGSMEADLADVAATGAKAEAQKPAADAPPDLMALFSKRLEGILPKVKTALAAGGPSAATIKQKVEEAGAQAKARDFTKAGQSLDAVEVLLKSPAAAAKPAPAPTPQPKPPAQSPKLSTYINATKDWKTAKSAAENGVFALKNAIMSACDPELKELVKARIDQLNAVLVPMDDAIVSRIQEAGNEPDEERQAERNQVVVKFANTMLDNLRKHPLASVADNNPFGTFAICSPVEAVLAKFVTSFGG